MKSVEYSKYRGDLASEMDIPIGVLMVHVEVVNFSRDPG